MIFSTQAKKQNYFLSQPHQPFFILGITNAIVMMLVFALSYKGVLSLQISSLNFHVYSLIFLVFTNIFIGFLFATFPRFCQSEIIKKTYYSKIFYLNLFGSIIFLVASFTHIYLVLASVAMLFISHIYTFLKLQTIYKTGNSTAKDDQKWILTSFGFGVFGHLLFLLSLLNLGLDIYAINISFYMYLIFLTFSVGQKMIPFFSHSLVKKDAKFVQIVFILFIFKTFLNSFELKSFEIVVDLILGAYLFKEILRWKLDMFNSPAILWVLHLGLFWLPVAFLLDAISLIIELSLDTDFYFFGLHLLALGFLTTIFIGFGTRVTLGHSMQPPHADKFVTNLFYFIQVVVLLRALYSVNVAFGWGANFLFDISFTTWLILFLLWSFRYAKVLIFGTKL